MLSEVRHAALGMLLLCLRLSVCQVSRYHPERRSARPWAGATDAVLTAALPGSGLQRLRQPLDSDPHLVPVTPSGMLSESSETLSPVPAPGGLSPLGQPCHRYMLRLAAPLAIAAWLRPGNGTRTHLALAGSWPCFAPTFCGSIHHSRFPLASEN